MLCKLAVARVSAPAVLCALLFPVRTKQYRLQYIRCCLGADGVLSGGIGSNEPKAKGAAKSYHRRRESVLRAVREGRRHGKSQVCRRCEARKLAHPCAPLMSLVAVVGRGWRAVDWSRWPPKVCMSAEQRLRLGALFLHRLPVPQEFLRFFGSCHGTYLSSV